MMNSEYKRLTSFHASWNTLIELRFTGSPIEYAEKGLYYDSSFAIRCAFCRFSFSLINPSDAKRFFDKLDYVHIQNSPLCPHMRGISEYAPFYNKPLYQHKLHRLVQEDFRLEVVRLKSFYGANPSIHRDRAAREGLYFKNRAIRCAFCPFQLSSELPVPKFPEDSALHWKHSPCPFSVIKNFQEDFILQSRLAREYENVPVAQTDTLCVPKRPEMEMFQKRYDTFDTEWPHESWLRKNDLARCGFYFRNTLDWVTCYWCDVTLGRWQPEDVPHLEHFQKSPRCRVALLAVNLTEKIALARKGLEPESAKYRLSKAEFEKLTQPKRVDPEETKSLKCNPPQKENSMYCVVCLEQWKSVLFLKCRHLVCCEKCSLQINDLCPLCRTPISEKLKVFL